MRAEAAEPQGNPSAGQRLFSAAEDERIVAEIAAALARGEPMAAGIRAVAASSGRSLRSVELRIQRALSARIRALRAAVLPAAELPAAELPVAAAGEAPAPPIAAAAPARQTVQARPAPDVAPTPVRAAVADHDLADHLAHLPHKLGKVAWGRSDDIMLMEAHCARKKMAEIALDLRADAKLLAARIDLLTGLHENDRGLKVARWPRTDVLAALKGSVA